jgi:hypothetical protein
MYAAAMVHDTKVSHVNEGLGSSYERRNVSKQPLFKISEAIRSTRLCGRSKWL